MSIIKQALEKNAEERGVLLLFSTRHTTGCKIAIKNSLYRLEKVQQPCAFWGHQVPSCDPLQKAVAQICEGGVATTRETQGCFNRNIAYFNWLVLY